MNQFILYRYFGVRLRNPPNVQVFDEDVDIHGVFVHGDKFASPVSAVNGTVVTSSSNGFIYDNQPAMGTTLGSPSFPTGLHENYNKDEFLTAQRVHFLNRHNRVSFKEN